jgi:FixJ family two-component response regulator
VRAEREGVPDPPIIAIVEDDESLRSALTGLVRSLGYRAEPFGSAEDLLGWEARRSFACIVTDIQLPGLSGIEMKQRLSAAGCTAPAIMITARTETELEQRALASGALCVLRKPFDADVLIACLKRALAEDTSPG